MPEDEDIDPVFEADTEDLVVDMDEDLDNADWTKHTWIPGINSLEELRLYLASSGTTPEHFKTLPVYRWNVDKIPWLKEL